jgi:hypothetical protein
MSKDTKAVPLVEGQEYTASITISSIGGSDELTVRIDKIPADFFDGDPEEFIEVPQSFLLVEELAHHLMSNMEEVAPVKAAPTLKLVN